MSVTFSPLILIELFVINSLASRLDGAILAVVKNSTNVYSLFSTSAFKAVL